MNLQNRLLLSIGITLLITFAIVETINYQTAKRNVEQVLWEQAEKVRNVLMSMRRIYHKQFVDSGVVLTEKTVGFLPAHAMSRISQDYYTWDNSDFSFANVSDQPRNQVHNADEVERNAMQYFRQNPQDQFFFQAFHQPNGEKFYMYARPIWVEEYCLKCHGNKEDAPPAIQALYDTAYNYQVGDLRGILSIKLPATVMHQRIWENFWQTFMIHLASFLAIFAIIVIIINRYVTYPLQSLSKGMQVVGAGNYQYTVENYPGEFGVLEQNFTGMIRQISDQQRHLNDLNQQLEQRIQERTQALQQAESANVAKSEFLANMSHELRTPLNAVLGYAQIFMRDANLSEKQKDGISIIKNSSEHLLTLINDILDLSKVESDRIELDPSEIHLNSFLRKTVQAFELRAQQKGIAFIFEPTPNLPTGIYADEKRIRQILINILGNAIKFTRHGGVTFRVAQEQEYLLFSVEDTGIGIDKDNLECIFQPFQQAGDKHFRPEGTGLGLAITQRLVNLMNGKLELTTTLGKGSIFTIKLPLVAIDQVEPPSQLDKPLIVGFSGVSKKIIISDDKWENRAVIAHLLQALGFETFEAANGRECLELLYSVKPDLIITDLVMPNLDGFETLRQIRNAGNTLPVIATSASIFEFNQQRSFESGFDAFLEKPIHVDKLLATLQDLLAINWIYSSTPESEEIQIIQPEQPYSDSCSEEITVEQAKIILELGKLGDIEGINQEIAKLRNTAPELAVKLATLAAEFETDAIAEMMAKFTIE